MTPSARSLHALRERGYKAESVERWIPSANVRKDLFGWLDIIACHPTMGILGVQVSTSEHRKARLDKARSCPGLIIWRLAGGRLAFHGWRKLAGRWVLEEIELGMEHLTEMKPLEGGY